MLNIWLPWNDGKEKDPAVVPYQLKGGVFKNAFA